MLYPQTGRFESDTVVHVRFAVEEGYYHSLTAPIYLFLSLFPVKNILIAIVLALVCILSITATKVLIIELAERMDIKMPGVLVNVFSFSANILSAFYFPLANKRHYIGYECANMWHNSTYIFMRLFAILTMIIYVKLYVRYKEGLSAKDWFVLAGMLALTTGFKASFLTVFAPALALILLNDLFKKTGFWKVVSIGTTVFPAMIVMYIQSLILSDGEGSGGYAIKPFEALSLRGDHPKAAIVFSIAFLLMTVVFHFKSSLADKVCRKTIVLWAVAFLEIFLMVETGERSLDGNFFWGYSIALFFSFVVAMLNSFRQFKNHDRNIFSTVLFFGEMAVLGWHVISGIWYFCLLLTGVTYFV